MIEIFTTSQGGDGAPSRSVGTEVTLTKPSDVYFSGVTPGIAFYEKSGSDLLVTLLDGSEVTINNFFVVGPAGDFSRLLREANGEEEVTGLLAPEPISAVPRFDDTEANEQELQELPAEDAVAQDDIPETDQSLGNGGAVEIAGDDSESSGAGEEGAGQGMQIAPSTLDAIFVGSAGIATLALMNDDLGGGGENRAATPPDPVDPSDPVDLTDPSDPVDPTDPGDPVDSTDPGDPESGILDPLIGDDGLLSVLTDALGAVTGADGLLGDLIGDDNLLSGLIGEGGSGLLGIGFEESGDIFGGLLDPLLGETAPIGGLLVGDGDILTSLLDDEDLFGGTPI